MNVVKVIFRRYRFRFPIFLLAISFAGLFAPVSLAGTVNIEYINPAASELTESITASLPDDVTPKTALQARRQAKRAKTITADTLNSFGYYAPTIRILVEESNGRPTPKLMVNTGPLFRLDRTELKFLGEPPRPEDAQKLETLLPVKKDQPAIPADIIDAERILGAELRKLGYAFSEIQGRDVIGDEDTATISVRYTLDTGPRVSFGDIIYPANIRTKKSYLERLNPTKTGTLYDPGKLALYNARLSDTRLFNSSNARLSPESVGTSRSGDAIHDIVLRVDERPRNTIALGGNYGTNEGFGVTAKLTRRNATRRGDVLISETRLAEREIGLNLIWRRPNELGYGKGLILTGEIKDENTDAFDQQLAKIGAGYEVIRGPRLSYNFGVNGQYIRETSIQRREDFQTIAAYAGIAIDKSDSLLDARKGWRAEGRIVPTYAFGGDRDQPYLRSVVQTRAYLPFGANDRFVAAGRVRAGTLIGATASDVPGDSRFYAGGGGSVRGYGYQAIGPFDENDVPSGGRSLLDASIEGRFRYNDTIGVVGFVDAGNVSDAQYPRFDNLRAGAGIGVRYMTPAGPLRLDAAIPLNPSSRDQKFQLYISIGQAF